MKGRSFVIIVLVILFSSLVNSVQCYSGEIDAITVVNNVIDGDTFNTAIMGKVRLADVNAPEWNETGGPEATGFLFQKIYGETVYLDIDEFPNQTYRRDIYDRLVCVVYIEHNLTHYENVNKAIWINGSAMKDDYPNDFNPNTWTLYVPKTELVPEFSFLLIPIFMIATLLTVIVYRKKHAKISWTP